MALQSLLLCPDEKTARVLSRVLAELEIGMEQCTEPFDAVKKLMRQRYDAVIVDWENEANATLVLKNARMSPSNKTSLAVAIVEGQTSVRNAFRAGANFVLYKPISVEQAKTSLRAARALMQRGAEAAAKLGGDAAASGPTLVPPPDFSGKTLGSTQGQTPGASSRMAPVMPMPAPSQSFGAPTMSAADASWGNTGTAAAPARDNPTTNPLDDLRNVASSALGSLKPSSDSLSAAPTLIESSSGRNSAQVKPFPTTSRSKTEEDSDFYHLDLDADPATEGRPRRQTAKSKEAQNAADSPRGSSASPVTPMPTAAAIQPFKPQSETSVKSGISFDEVRSRVTAQVPRSAPSFTLGEDTEEKTGGVPKPVLLGGVAVIVVALTLVAFMHFRSTPKPQPTAQVSSQPQQQALPQETMPATTAVSSSGEATVPPISQPLTATPKTEPKTGKEVMTKPSAVKTAQVGGTTTDSGDQQSEPEPELQVHKLATVNKPKVQVAVAEAAPPTMDALSANAGSGLVGGLMETPVSVPKLVAPDRVRISQGVSQGMLVNMVKPRYPEAARSMRLHGAVVLEALIGKDGLVKNLKVVQGHSMLAKAALDAVKQWRYKPYLLNGQPVSVETQITVKFTP
jgi:TonB family protein